MVIARRLLALFAVSALLTSGLGCTTTIARTEVLVVVDTDIRGDMGVDNIVVEVVGPTGVRQDSTAILGGVNPPLPRSVALYWEQGPRGPFTVRVIGNRGGSMRLTRTARFEFQRGETLILPMHLLASCQSMRCTDGQTCGETGCRDVDIAPTELLPYTSDLPRLDVAPMGDAGP